MFIKSLKIKKIFSVFFSAVFIFASVCGDFAYSAVNAEDAVKNITCPEIASDDTFKNYAKLTSSADFGGDAVVLNIQDFHMQPSVQRNISSIIDILVKKYGVKKVYVEGGYGDINSSWLSKIKDVKILNALLEDGVITGTEYYGALNAKSDFLIGLEDEKLHKENIVRLGTLIEKRDFYERKIDALRKDLNFMQQKYFGAKNIKLEKLIESSKSGKIPAAKYYARLIDARNKNAAQSLGKYGAAMPFDINDYPNICLFLYADKMRRNINGNKVEKELEKLIAGLKDSLSYGEYKAFLERVDDFQNVSQIAAELDRMPEEFKGKYFTPEITKFLDMSVKFRQINPIELVSEERMLVEDIRAALSLNKTELEISFLSDFFLYFEDYLKASISAADYEYLQKKFDKFITLWDKYAFYNQMKGLEADFKLLKDYYEANDKRNEIFLSAFSQNADIENKNFSKRVFNAPVSKIIEGKKDIIVVVTGGYHTKGLADLLNAKGVSYAVVTPSVSGKIEDALKNYENAAAEQAAIFSQSLQLSLFSQVLSYSINADAPSKEMAQGFFKSAAKTLAGVAYSQENVDVLINALNEAVAAGGYKYVYNAQTGYVTFQSSDGKYGEPFIQILKNQDGTISVSDEYLARELKDKVLLKDYGKLVSKEEFQEFVENMKTVLKVSTLDFGIDAFLPKVYASSLAIFSWAAKNGIYLDIDNLNGTTYDMERFGAAEEILPENPQIAKMPAPVQNAVARQYIKTLGYKGSALFAARMLNEFLPINQDTLEIYAAYPNSRAAEILNQIDALRKGERLDYASPINKPGTAGVRGAIGDRLAGLDIASAQVIAQAQADLAKEAGMSDQTISIAGDTRYGGSEFIKAVAGVFIANGFKVEIFESAIPTPLISFYTKDKGIGVNITASHNRGSDNGYKFTIDGAQASDDYAKKLMSRMDEIAELEKSGNAAVKYESPEGKMIVSPTRDVSVNYANALLQMAAGFFNISEQELKDRIRESQNAGKAPLFVFEVNNGASPVVWGDIFTAFGIDTNNVVMRNEGRDVTYGALTEEDRGAPEPNSKNLANLRKYIESIIAMERPIFGGATDVDSDRVGTLMYTDENKSPEVSGKLDNLPLAGLQGYGSNIKQKSDIVNSLAARQADVSKAIDESENNSPEVSDKSDNLSLSGLQGYGSNIKQKSDIVNSSIDENAKPEIKELTPNHIALIMAYAIAKSKGKGNFAANDVFVRTSPSTHLLDYFAALYGANTHPVNVGSKYIAEKINDAALNVQLGMESSGTILFKNWIYDKDGPMANILTYLIPIITGQSYSEILNEIYASAGYEFNFVEAKADLGKTEEEKAATKSAAVNFFKTASKEEIAKILPLLTLSDGTPAFPQGLELVSVNQSDGLYLGFRNAKTDEIRQKTGKPQQEGARDDIIWLQMRASGTENAVRIYAESYDETLTKQLVDLGQQIATQGGDRLNDIGEEKSYDKIKLEFNQAFELALDEPNKENVARLEDAAYNMSLYKTDDEQEQERIKRDIERAAIYLYGGIKLFLYSSEILERQLDEQPYEKSYLEKIYDDYLSAELLRSSSLVIAAKLYAVSYGYEFDAVTLGNIGFILNDITWFNFTIGRKNIAKVFDSIKEGDIEKTAQILINLCPPTVDEEQRQSRMQLGMKGFLDGSNKTGSSTLYSFSFLPLLAVFSQSDTFLGLNGTVWSAALSFAIIAAFFFGPMAVQKLLKSVRQRQGLTGLPEYKALKKHFKKLSKENIKKLRAGETAQDASVYRRELQGKNAKIAFDFSFNNINKETLKLLLDLAKARGVKQFIEDMFSGKKINTSENRAVLHIALRNVEMKDGKIVGKNSVMVDGKDVMPDIAKVLEKMKSFVEDVRSGKWKGATDKPVKHIISIGIGGSDLGPKMASQALSPYASENIKTHYLSNVDPAAWEKIKSEIPESEFDSVLVIVQSKTFTTQETITNAKAVKNDVVNIIKSLSGNQVSEADIVKKHFVAVSTAEKEVDNFGIDTENMFEFWDFVGGRFSIWSAIGMPLALSIGFDNFFEMLSGANEMDEHFRNADFENNMPVILAMLWVWYINFYGYDTHSVIPYSELYALFPKYLQQLLMESLGKSVDKDGKEVDYNTGAQAFGEAGTDSQHSFFQLFHQGTNKTPIDFISSLVSPAINPNMTEAERKNIEERHAIFFSNLLAQREAFAMGRDYNEVIAEADAAKAKAVLAIEQSSLSEEAKKSAIAFEEERYEAIKPQKAFDGNRPSNLIVFDKMNPEALGMTIALYEHITAVQSAIWNINAFDQWGVELGKKLAQKLQPNMLEQTQEKPEGFSASTNYWLDEFKNSKGSVVMRQNYPKVYSWLLNGNKPIIALLKLSAIETFPSLFKGKEFIEAHLDKDKETAAGFVKFNNLLKAAFLIPAALSFIVAASLPALPFIVIAASIAGLFAANTIRHINIDYRYVKNLSETINAIPSVSAKDLKNSSRLDVLIINDATALSEDPAELGFENTGLKADGKIIWKSVKTGRLIIFSDGARFDNINAAANDVMPAVLNAKGEKFEISSIAIDERDGAKKTSYGYDGALVLSKNFHNEIVSLSGGSLADAGEKIRKEQEAENFVFAKNFIMNLSGIKTKEELTQAINAYNKSGNQQIALPAAFFESMSGQKIKDFVSKMSENGARVFVVLDEKSAFDGHNFESLKSALINYGFAGYLVKEGQELKAVRDYFAERENKVSEISGFTNEQELISKIAASDADAVKAVNVENYISLISEGGERDISARIGNLIGLFSGQVLKFFNRRFSVQSAVQTALAFDMSAVPSLSQNDLEEIKSVLRTAGKLGISERDGNIIHFMDNAALLERIKSAVGAVGEFAIYEQRIDDNVENTVEKTRIKTAFYITIAQKAIVKADLNNGGLGLADKNLEDIMVLSAASQSLVDEDFINMFMKDISGKSAVYVYEAAKNKAVELNMREDKDGNKTAAATAYQLLLLYGERKRAQNEISAPVQIDVKAISAILSAA